MKLLKCLLWFLLVIGIFCCPITSIWARSSEGASNKNLLPEKVQWQDTSLAYEIVEIDKKRTSYQVWALTTLTLLPLFLLMQAANHPSHEYSIYIAASTLSIPIGVSWSLFFVELHKMKPYENLNK